MRVSSAYTARKHVPPPAETLKIAVEDDLAAKSPNGDQPASCV